MHCKACRVPRRKNPWIGCLSLADGNTDIVMELHEQLREVFWVRKRARSTLWISTVTPEDNMLIRFGSVEVLNAVPTERKLDLSRESVYSRTRGDSSRKAAYAHFFWSMTEPSNRLDSGVSSRVVVSQELVSGDDFESVGKYRVWTIVPCIKMIVDLQMGRNSCECTISCMEDNAGNQ